MKITGIQLAKRVETWQKRLGSLGLGHWRFSLVLCDQTPGGPLAKASAEVSHAYDTVTFYFTHEFLEDADDRDLDECILHEWVHVAMRDLDAAIEEADDFLSAASLTLWTDRVGHAREGLVDRLSRQIYALYNAT